MRTLQQSGTFVSQYTCVRVCVTDDKATVVRLPIQLVQLQLQGLKGQSRRASSSSTQLDWLQAATAGSSQSLFSWPAFAQLSGCTCHQGLLPVIH